MLFVVRYAIPGLLAAAGTVVVLVGGSAAEGVGGSLIGVALILMLINAFVRLGLQSEADREREERARVFFDRHGRWPDGG